jgi:hypothetical protein
MHNGVDFPKRRADKQQIEAVSLAHHLQADVRFSSLSDASSG